MGAATAPTSFGKWLRTELDSRKIGVRTLARAIDPQQTELIRRNLNRYLRDGVRPSPVMRSRIADALGVESSVMPLDEDDEEADPVSALMTAIRRVVRLELEAAKELA